MRYRIAAEELEVDKLHNAEQKANQTGDYDELYQKQQELIEKDEPKDEEENTEDVIASDNTDASNNDQEADVSADETDTQESDSELEVAKESLRQLSYYELPVTNIAISAEDFGGSGSLARDLTQSVLGLAKLGVQYAPMAIKKLFKGVLLLMGRIVRLSFNSIDIIQRYIARRANSFTSLQQDIVELKKTLTHAKGAEDIANQSFMRQKTINVLKIGKSLDLSENVQIMTDFVSDMVGHIGSHISKDLVVSKHIMNYSSSGVSMPAKLLVENSFDNVLLKEIVAGFEPEADNVDSFIYRQDLPGDVKFISFLPRDDISELDDIARAYNNSKMFLGFDAESFEDINSINYMTIDELNKFLDKLDALCSVCIEHQSVYKTILSKKKASLIWLKHFYNGLISSSHKVSVKDSLLEFIYLKSIFIDKVYLVAAMDIHDYSVKVITNGLSFAKDNAKKLI